MSIDDRLLQTSPPSDEANTDSANSSGFFRESVREQRRQSDLNQPADSVTNEDQDFRSTVKQSRDVTKEKARGANAEDSKDGLGGQVKKLFGSAEGTLSAEALKAGWENVAAFNPLGLIWVNIHAYLHVFAPKKFGQLGTEWGPPIKSERGGAVFKLSGMLAKTIEPMGLVISDLILILLIILAAGIIAIIVGFFKDPIMGTLWLIKQLLGIKGSKWL
jgi:hypothetical protein